MGSANLIINDGFPPIADGKGIVLILGTMPSIASLQAQEYYAHSRNAFWPIMQALFGEDGNLPYAQRRHLLTRNHVAVWDVLQSCHRPGSLDANIDINSIKVNDFSGFFEANPNVSSIFFNGGMAEKLYRQSVLPKLEKRLANLHSQRLPSTSPAYAVLSLQQKIAAWQVIKQQAVK